MRAHSWKRQDGDNTHRDTHTHIYFFSICMFLKVSSLVRPFLPSFLPSFPFLSLPLSALRWMPPEAYASSVDKATSVQRSLDSVHLTVDLLKLSCRLLQQLLLAVEHPSKKKKSPKKSESLTPVPAITVSELMSRIPSPTRSDLANKFLDL